MNYNDKQAEVAEKIVKEYLDYKEYMTYSPDNKKRPHCFDFVCTYKKDKVFFVDVKFKQNSTFAKGRAGQHHGINVETYNEYLDFIKITSSPFFLVFVDLKEEKVYKVELLKLTNPAFVGKKGEIVCWNIEQMEMLFKLSPQHIERLKNPDSVEVKSINL